MSTTQTLAGRKALKEALDPDLQIITISDGDEWGLDRSQGIGGSEAGSVMGLNKYRGPLELLEEKVTGKTQEFTKAQELRMACGHALELLTLQTFADRVLDVPYRETFDELVNAGIDGLTRPEKTLFINARHPHAFAHIDGIYRRKVEIGIVDAKASFRDPWPGVPEYYLAQLAHYGAVLGVYLGWIAGMFMGHPYPLLQEYRIEFTSTQLELVMKAERIFWNGVTAIRGGKIPGEDALSAFESKLVAIGEEFMAGFGTSPVEESRESAIVTLDEDQVTSLRRFTDLKQQVSTAYKEIDEISDAFKEVSDAKNVTFVSGDGEIVAKKSTVVTRALDKGALAEAGVPVDAFYGASEQVRFTAPRGVTRRNTSRTRNGDVQAGRGISQR